MSLIFCRDGVLRIETWVPETKRYAEIPLAVLETAGEANFLSKIFDLIAIEDGLTVRELFRNLAPWADTMSYLAQMDFPAFLAESEKPLRHDEDERPLSHIEIFASAHFGVEGEFEFPDGDPLATLADKDGVVQKSRAKPLITDRYSLRAFWTYSGIYAKDPNDAQAREQRCTLDYTPLDTWHHLPIRILPVMRIDDHTPNSRHASTKEPVLNPKHPRVVGRLHRGALLLELGMDELFELGMDELFVQPTFHEALLQGFFQEIGFHHSPAQRDAATSDIRKRVEAVTGNPSDGAPAPQPDGPAAGADKAPSRALVLLSLAERIAPALVRLRADEEAVSPT